MNKMKLVILTLGAAILLTACNDRARESSNYVEGDIQQEIQVQQEAQVQQEEKLQQDEQEEQVQQNNKIQFEETINPDESSLKDDNSDRNIIGINNKKEYSKKENVPDSDEYVLSETITVSENRELILKLYGKKLSDEYDQYGIREIEVFDGETLLQNILIQEAITAEWGEEVDFEGYTLSLSKESGFQAKDMNFDNAEDIGLIGWITSGANIPYYYWIWDATNNRFNYAFTLCNAELDTKKQQIISWSRNGWDEYIIEYYKYDEIEGLKLVKREIQKVDDTSLEE